MLKNAINTKDTDDNDNEEVVFDPLKELESKLLVHHFSMMIIFLVI